MVVVVMEGDNAGSVAGEVRGKIESVMGARGLVVSCPDAGACAGAAQRVRVRMSASKNRYCYDKFAFVGSCLTPGQRIVLAFAYYNGQQLVGSDSVSAETPQRVNYKFQYADSGPDSSDVWSATTEALSSQLAKAKLKIPY